MALDGSMANVRTLQQRLAQLQEQEMNTREGTNNEFLWGMVLAFLMPIIMILFMFEPSVPRKQRIGIVTGVSINLSFSLVRTLLGG